MTQLSPISHLMREPDWAALNLQTPYQCAHNIHGILESLEGAEKVVYAIRGEALRIFDDRQLYEQFNDPATNLPCTCTFRFLQIYLPGSYRYCEDALRNRQQLHDSIPLDVAAKIKRVNLKLLEGVSDGVRKLPSVQQDAVDMSEKDFAAELSTEHHQHIKPRIRRVLNFTPEQFADVEECLESVAEQNMIFGGEQLKTWEDRIWALSVSWNQDHQKEVAEVLF